MFSEFNIPEILKTDRDGFNFLAGLWHDAKDCKENIKFNFDRCKFIEVNLAAVLGAMFDRLLFNGATPYVTYPDYIGSRRSLVRTGFYKNLRDDAKNEDRERYIPYRRFSIKESLSFKEYIHDEFTHKKRFPQCTETAELKIIEIICEVFANAVTHGGSMYVYCCGESHERFGIPMLDMSIVNMGTTIPDLVNEHLYRTFQKELSPCDCIHWAFKKGNTTKSTPGGLGLDILNTFITLNEGKLQMVSGTAMVDYSDGEHQFDSLDYPFPGTIVNLEINCADNKIYDWTNDNDEQQDIF